MSAYCVQNITVLCLTLASVFFCLSSAEEQCYGSTYQLPYIYSPAGFRGQLFFTPTNGGATKLVLQNRKLQDPRFRTPSNFGLIMPDLTEQDNGVFSVSLDDGRLMNVITLVVKDCREPQIKYYWGVLSVRIPEGAAFLEFTPAQNLSLVTVVWNHTDPNRSRGSVNREYWEMPGITQDHSGYYKFRGKDNKLLAWKRVEVKDWGEPATKYYGGVFSLHIPEGAALLEFTPVQNLSLATVVWNHTDPNRSRGSVNREYWEMTGITQDHSGYYKFRDKDNKLMAMKRLEVKEYEKQHERDEGGDIYIKYPDESDKWTVTFIRGVNQYTLEKGGIHETSGPFSNRIEFLEDAIIIDPLQYEDSGTFEFRDVKGNLAQRVELEVKTSFPAPLYYVIIAGCLFLVCGIYCCVKKCCCKKRYPKRNNPAPQPEAAPAVYYHDTAQPTGPSQSTTSPASVYQPTSTTDGPPVTAPGGQRATPLLSNSSDFISSDSEPQFHMKGISFASAPPLNSDTTISDVYTSDKLNFL